MSKQPTTVSERRPPIVTIMGHVDHGKTSLLDYIRKTRVALKEHGGITQHIGAYQASVEYEKKTRLITFIDTPGHAAFSQMRSRGGKVADVVVLVIAASEGIKPQTEESLKHIQAANVPFLVALTKSDLPTANPDKVKNELATLGYLTEDRGGQIVAVEVSAHTGNGVIDLLEAILLVSDMHDIHGSVTEPLKATVIESHRDPARGNVASIVVTAGTIKVRDEIWAGAILAKVKAIVNDRGKNIPMAIPGTPVQILGWEALPQLGSVITSQNPQVAKSTSSTHGSSIVIPPHLKKSHQLMYVLRADTQGSLEAIRTALPKDIIILSDGVGDITPSDVVTAKMAEAQVLGFSVNITADAQTLAETDHIQIKTFDIIYEMLDFIEDAQKRLVDPYYDREIIGKADIIAIFQIDKQRIAGCKVTEGEMLEKVSIDIYRKDRLVGTGRIASLRQGKQIVPKVPLGKEFGAQITPFIDFKVADRIIAFKNKSN